MKGRLAIVKLRCVFVCIDVVVEEIIEDESVCASDWKNTNEKN